MKRFFEKIYLPRFSGQKQGKKAKTRYFQHFSLNSPIHA